MSENVYITKANLSSMGMLSHWFLYYRKKQNDSLNIVYVEVEMFLDVLALLHLNL